jgi:hypothetical protein
VIWIGLLVFFGFIPPLLAYQHRRYWTLAFPALLVAVAVEWTIVDSGDSDGVAEVALVMAIGGLILNLCVLALVQRRDRRRPR